MTSARYLLELALVAAFAAACGWAVPRAMFPSQAPPREAPSTEHATTESVSEEAAPEPVTVAVAVPARPREAPTPVAAPTTVAVPRATGPRSNDTGRVASPAVAPAARSLPPALRRSGDRWVVDLQRMGEPRTALAGADARPVDPESAQGFAIASVDRGGYLHAAGIRPGDVLVEVNGMPTLTADQALDVYARSRAMRSFSLRFRRGGASYTVRVDVQNAPAGRGLASFGSRGS